VSADTIRRHLLFFIEDIVLNFKAFCFPFHVLERLPKHHRSNFVTTVLLRFYSRSCFDEQVAVTQKQSVGAVNKSLDERHVICPFRKRDNSTATSRGRHLLSGDSWKQAFTPRRTAMLSQLLRENLADFGSQPHIRAPFL
jgi:hypothetical protein